MEMHVESTTTLPSDVLRSHDLAEQSTAKSSAWTSVNTGSLFVDVRPTYTTGQDNSIQVTPPLPAVAEWLEDKTASQAPSYLGDVLPMESESLWVWPGKSSLGGTEMDSTTPVFDDIPMNTETSTDITQDSWRTQNSPVFSGQSDVTTRGCLVTQSPSCGSPTSTPFSSRPDITPSSMSTLPCSSLTPTDGSHNGGSADQISYTTTFIVLPVCLFAVLIFFLVVIIVYFKHTRRRKKFRPDAIPMDLYVNAKTDVKLVPLPPLAADLPTLAPESGLEDRGQTVLKEEGVAENPLQPRSRVSSFQLRKKGHQKRRKSSERDEVSSVMVAEQSGSESGARLSLALLDSVGTSQRTENSSHGSLERVNRQSGPTFAPPVVSYHAATIGSEEAQTGGHKQGHSKKRPTRPAPPPPPSPGRGGPAPRGDQLQGTGKAARQAPVSTPTEPQGMQATAMAGGMRPSQEAQGEENLGVHIPFRSEQPRVKVAPTSLDLWQLENPSGKQLPPRPLSLNSGLASPPYRVSSSTLPFPQGLPGASLGTSNANQERPGKVDGGSTQVTGEGAPEPKRPSRGLESEKGTGKPDTMRIKPWTSTTQPRKPLRVLLPTLPLSPPQALSTHVTELESHIGQGLTKGKVTAATGTNKPGTTTETETFRETSGQSDTSPKDGLTIRKMSVDNAALEEGPHTDHSPGAPLAKNRVPTSRQLRSSEEPGKTRDATLPMEQGSMTLPKNSRQMKRAEWRSASAGDLSSPTDEMEKTTETGS